MSTSPTPEDLPDGSTDPVEVAEAFLAEISEHQILMVPRWRRLVRTLHGLGILSVTGPEWARITPTGMSFGELTPEQADRLIHLLEDLEDEIAPVGPPEAAPDQPVFEFPPPVRPPVFKVSPHHVVAAR